MKAVTKQKLNVTAFFLLEVSSGQWKFLRAAHVSARMQGILDFSC